MRGLKDDTRDEDRASIKQRTRKEEGKLISKHPIMGNKEVPSPNILSVGAVRIRKPKQPILHLHT